MTKTEIITDVNGQALKIPSEMHTDRKEFIIKQIGATYIAYPADDPWLPLKQTIGKFPIS